jgi:hypothetical protein
MSRLSNCGSSAVSACDAKLCMQIERIYRHSEASLAGSFADDGWRADIVGTQLEGWPTD